MPLSEKLQGIRDMRLILAEESRQHRADLKAKALEFAAMADAGECLELINVLIETVSSITGCATELEDAACKLELHIENEGE